MGVDIDVERAALDRARQAAADKLVALRSIIEEFTRNQVTGSSPLMVELDRSRGNTMKTAVATLQSEQDELVRRSADEVMVLRGGPGTGKTVVGLHRAAWLVYNDRRVLSNDILIVGPCQEGDPGVAECDVTDSRRCVDPQGRRVRRRCC